MHPKRTTPTKPTDAAAAAHYCFVLVGEMIPAARAVGFVNCALPRSLASVSKAKTYDTGTKKTMDSKFSLLLRHPGVQSLSQP